MPLIKKNIHSPSLEKCQDKSISKSMMMKGINDTRKKTKDLLLNYLLALKSDLDKTKEAVENMDTRLVNLENTTSFIFEKLNQKPGSKIGKMKTNEGTNTESTKNAKLSLELKERVAALEECVKKTNQRLDTSVQLEDTILSEVTKLNSEAKLMKQACVEIIHHELATTKQKANKDTISLKL